MVCSCWNRRVEESQRGYSATRARPYAAGLQPPQIRTRMQVAREGGGLPAAGAGTTEGTVINFVPTRVTDNPI